MSEVFIKYPNDLAVILMHAGDAFEFEDRKSVQHILIYISQNSPQTKLNFEKAISLQANNVVASLLNNYG